MARRLDSTFATDPVLGGGQGRTVLVVDPDRTARTVLVNLLRPEGYRVLEAERADKALFLALEKSIDAFLIAQQPSGLTAADLCGRIRAMARYRQVPILSILMPFDETAVSAAFAAGADDFLTRPVHPQNLRTRLAGRLLRAQATHSSATSQEGLAKYLVPRLRHAHDDSSSSPETASDVSEVCVMAVRLTLEGAAEGSSFQTVARFLGRQVDCIYRHGGYVARLEADGLRAVFEAPDRLERAVSCLQELRTQLLSGPAAPDHPVLQLHASLCEGPLCLSPGSSPAPEADLLEIAADLCAQAGSMEILVSESLIDRVGATVSGFLARVARTPADHPSRGLPPGAAPARPRAA